MELEIRIDLDWEIGNAGAETVETGDGCGYRMETAEDIATKRGL